jgi:hypothetical protein
MLATHSSPCTKIFGAITPFPTALLRPGVAKAPFAGKSREKRVFFSRLMREILAHRAKSRGNNAKNGRKQAVLQVCDFWHRLCLKILQIEHTLG